MKGKRIFTTAWAFALWMLGSVAAHAAEQPEWRVTLDVQMVAISPAKALKLVPALCEPGTFDNAFAEVQRMIERDEADLVAWPVLVSATKPLLGRDREIQSAPNGLPAGISNPDESPISETVIEATYPTEFVPPDVPQTFGSPWPVHLFPFLPGVMTTPTAFETRNLGVTLEAEAIVSTIGASVDLSVSPERGLLLEYQTIRSMINPTGIVGIFPQPQFHIDKMHSHLTIPTGKRILLGVFVEAKPEAKVLLFLMKAVVARTGERSPRP